MKKIYKVTLAGGGDIDEKYVDQATWDLLDGADSNDIALSADEVQGIDWTKVDQYDLRTTLAAQGFEIAEGDENEYEGYIY